jgi:hypothetical protein
VSKLSAFFYYYGAKNALARKYPAPEHGTIIEPFAGSAAYSLAYPDRRVLLYDLDERVCGVWDYLIRTPEREILALPDLPFDGCVDELPVCQEARWLIGLNLAVANQSVRTRWSSWGWSRVVDPFEGNVRRVWTAPCRVKIARQQRAIRHWRIHHAPWTSAPVMPDAAYFVDPPYQVAGKHYRHGAKGVDFDALGAWCRTSPGQVIACEAEGATWLPFRLLEEIASQGRTGEKKGSGRSREVVWTNRELTRGRQMQWLDVLAGAIPANDNAAIKEAAE